MADRNKPHELRSGHMMVGEATSTSPPPLFTALYEQEHAPMVRLARLIVGSTEVAEELVHDAFIAVYGRLQHLDTPGAYLRQVVINNCRSHIRRSGTGKAKVVELISRTPVDEHVSLPPELDETWRSLRVLNDQQRTALVLRYHLDLPINDIADLMDIRPGTVKSTIHRGLAALRKELSS